MKKFLTFPKILGFVLIILSVGLFFLRKNVFGFLLNFVVLFFGLVLLLFKRSLTDRSFKFLLRSFKTLNLLWCWLFEVLFWLCSLGIILVCGVFLKNFAGFLQGVVPSNIEFLGELPDMVLIKKYFVLALLIIILGLLLWNLVYSVSRFFCWSLIKNKKFSFKFLLRFCLLNLVWWLLWAPLFLLVLLGLKKEVLGFVFFIALLLYFYLSPVLHFYFFSSGRIWKSISSALQSGFAFVPKFVVPYSFGFIMMILLFFVGKIFPYPFVQLLFVCFFVALFRIFLNFFMSDVFKV